MFNFVSSSQVAPVASDAAKPRRSRRRRKAKGRNKIEPLTGSKTMAEKHVQQGKKKHDAPMTKRDLYFALDCEMVGVGPDGLDSAVGRVSIVNWDNQVVLDTFVQVRVPVTDYRTFVSGITPDSIRPGSARPFEEVRATVQDILRGKILIGHGLECDLNALGLSHPWCDIRDTANYSYYMREFADQSTGQVKLVPRKLRDLTWDMLKRQIQNPNVPHNPIEDCVAALDLYKAVRSDWEENLIKLGQQKEKQRQLENQRRWHLAAAASSQPGHTTMAPPPPPPPQPIYHHMGVPQLSPPPPPPPPPPPAGMVTPQRAARGAYQLSSNVFTTYAPVMQVRSMPNNAITPNNQAFIANGAPASQPAPSRSWFSARRLISPTRGNRQDTRRQDNRRDTNNNMIHRISGNQAADKPSPVVHLTPSEDHRHVLPSTTASTTDSAESYDELKDKRSDVEQPIPDCSSCAVENENEHVINEDYEPPKYFTSSPEIPNQQALQTSWFSFLRTWPLQEPSSDADADTDADANVNLSTDANADADADSDSSEYFDELKGAELLCLGAEAFNRESSNVIVLDSKDEGLVCVNDDNANGNGISQ